MSSAARCLRRGLRCRGWQSPTPALPREGGGGRRESSSPRGLGGGVLDGEEADAFGVDRDVVDAVAVFEEVDGVVDDVEGVASVDLDVGGEDDESGSEEQTTGLQTLI